MKVQFITIFAVNLISNCLVFSTSLACMGRPDKLVVSGSSFEGEEISVSNSTGEPDVSLGRSSFSYNFSKKCWTLAGGAGESICIKSNEQILIKGEKSGTAPVIAIAKRSATDAKSIEIFSVDKASGKIDLKGTKLLIDVTEKKDLESYNGDEVSLAIAPFRGDVQTGIYRSKSSTSDPVYRGMVKPDGPFDIVGRKVG